MGENDPITQEQMNEFLFSQVVLMFQGAAWQHMGKVMNPGTNKVERDLAQAKHSIDMLGMLEAKTKGNLSDNEQRFLEHALYELRMNYIDEVNKGPDEADAPADEAEAPAADAEAPAADAEAPAADAETPAKENGGDAAETAEAESPKDEASAEAKEEESD